MMIQRITIQFAVLLMLFTSLPLAAKVSGLPDFTELVEKAGPAVVNIRVTQFGNRNPSRDEGEGQPEDHPEIPEFFRRYFNVPGDPRGPQPDRTGAGSGFIYSDDGYVMTNHHVIEDADEIIVRLADRREFEAELVGSDESSDIAVLKINAKKPLPFLHLGESESIKADKPTWPSTAATPVDHCSTWMVKLSASTRGY
jgi:serine protease Do